MNPLVRAFIMDRKSQNMSAKTIRWHTHSLQKFTDYLEQSNNLVPTQWTRSTMREFIVHLQDSGLSEASVRTCVNSVWAFVRWIYEEGYIDENIVAKVKKPKVSKKQKESISSSDLLKILDAASRTINKERDVAIILLMVDTGLRAQEICNLTVGDFHHEESLILVREGKGKKDRLVPIDTRAAMAIYKYLGKKRPLNLKKDEPLFLSKRHTFLTTFGLNQLIHRLEKKAGLDGVHPHRFRHTYALHYLRNGGDALSLQRVLGHTTLDVTRIYVNMMTEDLSRVHEIASPVKHLK